MNEMQTHPLRSWLGCLEDGRMSTNCTLKSILTNRRCTARQCDGCHRFAPIENTSTDHSYAVWDRNRGQRGAPPKEHLTQS